MLGDWLVASDDGVRQCRQPIVVPSLQQTARSLRASAAVQPVSQYQVDDQCLMVCGAVMKCCAAALVKRHESRPLPLKNTTTDVVSIMNQHYEHISLPVLLGLSNGDQDESLSLI